MSYETILSACDDAGIRTITLNRPDVLNAMNATLVRETALAFEEANGDDATRVIIFTGAGKGFCSGDDLTAHEGYTNEADARRAVKAIQRVTHAISLGDKVVVGAINGWAVGGGFEWAINCDFPIWAESAKAFFPELYWGMFVTGGVTSLLPAMAGLNAARELLFLGEKHTAKDLKTMGVAWRVVADSKLLKEAHKVASKIASLPPGAVRDMKRTLAKTAATNIEAAMALETDATVRGFLDPETKLRIESFSQG